MYSYLIIALVFAILSQIAKAIADKVQFHFHESVFKDLNQNWWNPEVSWQNKYKDGCEKFGEKFFGSTTFLVFITDAWHFFNWLQNRFIDLYTFFILINIIDTWYISVLLALLPFVLKSVVFEWLFSKKLKK